MKLNLGLFPLASAITAGIGYTVTTLSMMYRTKQTLQMTADLLHMKTLRPIMPLVKVTSSNYMSGLFQVVVATFLFTFVTVALYNFMVKRFQ